MANRSSAASMICLTALALLLLITSSLQAQGRSSSMNMKLAGGKQKQSGRSLSEYVPVRSVVYRSMALPATARTTEAEGYQPFELCEGCRCCSTSNASSSSCCVETSCCYSIDCNIPGKPYGTCAFTPHTCGCGDTNCTQPS